MFDKAINEIQILEPNSYVPDITENVFYRVLKYKTGLGSIIATTFILQAKGDILPLDVTKKFDIMVYAVTHKYFFIL